MSDGGYDKIGYERCLSLAKCKWLLPPLTLLHQLPLGNRIKPGIRTKQLYIDLPCIRKQTNPSIWRKWFQNDRVDNVHSAQRFEEVRRLSAALQVAPPMYSALLPQVLRLQLQEAESKIAQLSSKVNRFWGERKLGGAGEG
jgi:hypothetical protein